MLISNILLEEGGVPVSVAIRSSHLLLSQKLVLAVYPRLFRQFFFFDSGLDLRVFEVVRNGVILFKLISADLKDLIRCRVLLIFKQNLQLQ